MASKIQICALLFLGLLLASTDADELETKKAHKYDQDDKVPFQVNKIGPYANPSETYEYYNLPFCKPKRDDIQHGSQSLGEHIGGDHRRSALYNIRFNVNIQFTELCTVELTPTEIRRFKKAIDEYYYFEMFYDDLPLRGFIGTVDTDRNDDSKKTYYLFKHLHFYIERNKNRVIYANVTADPRRVQALDENDQNDEGLIPVQFSYSAEWHETDTTFENRNNKFIEDFFNKELEIHWLSIMNSFVLVLLLTGFLAIIIMRILKSDYNRYQRPTDGEEDEPEDYGWKLIHGDVFRFPPHKNLFTSFVGLGTQCVAILFGLLTLAVFGLFHPNSGDSIFTYGIILYALTSVIGGFVSARFYKQMGGENWVWNIVLCATLLLVPIVAVFSYVNSVAIAYDATAAVPAKIIVVIACIVLFVGFPLAVVGGIAGRRAAGPFEAPCRTKNFPREIPPIPWYRSLPFQMVMSGFLPFSAIYIELFYLYSSVWGHTTYQLFRILFLVAVILLIVTACITVALTYFQLSMEDHRWWWSSFLSGGSTGLFIYAYSIFYYIYRSRMSGVLQASFYFGWMAVICYFFFVMLGTVGFVSSLTFVRRIYKDIHTD
eukprot:TRINITY_DN471_c0_g1_i1.p1 TRINITY_DN471_c0_g1~~TRINITY_DN471_c0_g1_i1.p1  ORF type:complete len:601 (+),score=153.15 TRINITY_DN471_c0_g1_i1:208-2010(+)